MTIRELIHTSTEHLLRIITQPRSELTRWQRAARFTYDLARTGAQQLRRDRASQMAAALAYRTLFSLLPILAVGTALVRAFSGQEQFLSMLEDAMLAANFDSIMMVSREVGETTTLIEWLLPVAEHAASRNLAAVGWVGLCVLVYAALSFVVTIENSFNSICQAAEGRSWVRRVPMYWFVLTVAPIVIAVTLYFGTVFDEWVAGLNTWNWLLYSISEVSRFASIFLFLLAIYSLVPNAEVNIKPAMVGAFVAAVLVTIVTRFLGVYVSNAVSFTQITGSLGFIPVFMFAVYLFWLVILFGLEVAVTLQRLPGRTLEELQQRRAVGGIVDPATVIAVMDHLASRFTDGQSSTAHTVAEAVTLPESTARIMLDELVAAGFVHQLGEADRGFVLARPAEQIDLRGLIDLGFRLADGGVPRPATGLLWSLREAQRTLAEGTQLSALRHQHAPPATP